MNKKTIFKGMGNASPGFVNAIEISSPTITKLILISLDDKKIYLNLDTAEEFCSTLNSYISVLRE